MFAFRGMDNHLLRTDVPNSVSQKSEQRHRVFTQPESEMDMSRRLIFRPAKDRTFLRTAALRRVEV
jgi:hypothetical protein